MILFLLLLWGGALLLIARWMCGKWLNHLSLYTATWTLSLTAYELRLVSYDNLGVEGWLYICAAWIAVYIGSALVLLGHRPLQYRSIPDGASILKGAIILLSLAGFASSVVLARNITHLIDSNLLIALTLQSHLIYPARVAGELSALPYIQFLPYAACALAGVYAAGRGRIDWVSILPLLAATVDGVLTMSRAAMTMGAILFVSSLYLAPKSKPVQLTRLQRVGLVGVLIAGFLLVSWTRQVPSALDSQGKVLNRISDSVPQIPVLYVYLSGPPAGLGAYLRNPNLDGDAFFGRYTFAPVYRLLSRFGFDTFVPYLQEFYYTPVAINTCTYLREIHSDFGTLGVVFFPCVLGLIISWLEYVRKSLARTMVLAHLYVVVLFAFNNLIMLTGFWFQSLLVSSVVAAYLESRGRIRATVASSYTQGLPSQAKLQ